LPPTRGAVLQTRGGKYVRTFQHYTKIETLGVKNATTITTLYTSRVLVGTVNVPLRWGGKGEILTWGVKERTIKEECPKEA